MNSEVSQLDRLEEAWRSLRETIRKRETELDVLKKQFQILDQARALLIMRAGTTAEAALPLFMSKPSIGLKEAILECLSASEFGLDMPELTFAVASKVEENRYASERSLYAAVQTTVRRMVARGEIMMTAYADQRRYVVAHHASNVIPTDRTDVA